MIAMGMLCRGHAIVACVPESSGDGFVVAAQRGDTSFTTFCVDSGRKIYSQSAYGIPDLAYAVAAMLDRADHSARPA